MSDVTGKHRPAEKVIIYGDCWPVVSTVCHLTASILPDSLCHTPADPDALIQVLTREPGAALLLCLRPREHIFLFCALKNVLPRHPVLVISDEIFYSDRVILRHWGQLPVMTHQSLSPMVTSQRLRELYPFPGHHCPEQGPLTDFLMAPALPPGLPEIPSVFLQEEDRLMDYMSLLIYREMVQAGVTPFREKLLQTMCGGIQDLHQVAQVMNVSYQKVWYEKRQLFARLGMPGHLRELLWGTHFYAALQRTPFILPVMKTRQEAPQTGQMNRRPVTGEPLIR
ncbi:TPA: hypothetical protein I8Y21_002246 [Klebsiella oxytoca]|uniref:Transcriptional regulator n=1 Tax=Klebsiella oxytoca TaxID=571 RepID=A0AAN5L758_KLEOX|nr:hypothetical protein [Klebsiella oxytoca]